MNYQDIFNVNYKKAKKDISQLKNLVIQSIQPFDRAFSKVGAVECKKGCSYCCHLRVAAYPYEIAAINYHINNKSTESYRNKIRNKITEQFEVIKDLTMDEHYAINVECPFLVDGSCSIYSIRPISCAGYHSLDKQACIDSYHSCAGNLPFDLYISEVQLFQKKITEDALKFNSEDYEQYELIRSLYKIQENPKAIQRWKNGRKMFK